MAEVSFYHLQRQSLEAVLPTLLQRSLGRGWRVVVECSSAERMAALDQHLWTFSDDSFLPHATTLERDLADEPVVITDGSANPNGATVRFLVDGAPLPPDLDRYERVVLMLDGHDEVAVVAARDVWKSLRGSAHTLAYWQQNEDGRWERKA